MLLLLLPLWLGFYEYLTFVLEPWLHLCTCRDPTLHQGTARVFKGQPWIAQISTWKGWIHD